MLRIAMIALASLVAILVLTLVGIRLFGVAQFDRLMNRVVADPTAPVPDASDLAFHRSLFVVDLHADTLKWDRDILARSSFGHVDLPRLVEGGIGLQVFTIVTRSPIPRVEDGRLCVSGTGVNVTGLLSAAQGRPLWSLRERAYAQIDRLKEAAARSRARPGPELRLITGVDDLRRLVADRRAGREVVGALLGIEGGHWIGEGDPSPSRVAADMRALFERGVRVFAPTHRFDNSLSGASEGCERGGLTPQGIEALEAAERLGMVVDLAHISPRGLRDAAALLGKPFVISHTGVQAGCEAPCRPDRNLSDEDIALVLRAGGVIGIGTWPQAIGDSVLNVADAMAHVMQVAGTMGLEPGRHIAIGQDFDGSVVVPFDTGGTPILTAILRRRADVFDEPTIRNIAGLNACRLFARVLPGGGDEAAREICEPGDGRSTEGAAARP